MGILAKQPSLILEVEYMPIDNDIETVVYYYKDESDIFIPYSMKYELDIL